jgi:hypothetical protein
MTRISEFAPAAELQFADRLLRMRTDIAALGGVASGVNSFEAVGQRPYDIVALTAVASGTAVTLRWSPILASNLRHYEVLIGSESDGSDGLIYQTTQPEYTDVAGGPGITRYARVRAVLADGSPVVWSDTINLNSGFLLTDSIEFAAVLNYVQSLYGNGLEAYLTSGLLGLGGGHTYRVTTHSSIKQDGTSPAVNTFYTGSDLQAIYPGTAIIETIGGPVQVRVSATIDYFHHLGGGARLAILRNGVEIIHFGKIGYNVNSTMPYGSVITYSPGISFIEIPPPGIHVYEVEIRAERGPDINGVAEIAIYKLRMGVLEFRR